MSLVVEFVCELPNGVHARPASHVETLCNTFTSDIEWLNLRTGSKGDAKSALALIGTDTLMGDACQLLISGHDEHIAHQRLSQWLQNEFPHCDAPLPAAVTAECDPLPLSLAHLNPTFFRAQPVCGGSASGILLRLRGLDLQQLDDLPAARSVEEEQAALDAGLARLGKSIALRLLESDSTMRKPIARSPAIPRCASIYCTASAKA